VDWHDLLRAHADDLDAAAAAVESDPAAAAARCRLTANALRRISDALESPATVVSSPTYHGPDRRHH